MKRLIGIVLCVYVAYMGIVDEVIAKTEDTPEPIRSMLLYEITNYASDSITYSYGY